MICDECETVAHCSKHGCIPKHQALEKMAENARELGLDYEQYENAIEVSVIFHKGQRMFAVPKQPALHPCRSPYCECSAGQCSHPGCYDARGESWPTSIKENT